MKTCKVKIGRESESEIIWRSQTFEPKATSSSSSANECCGLPILGKMDGFDGELIDDMIQDQRAKRNPDKDWQIGL